MNCAVLYGQGDTNKWCLDSVEVKQVRKDYAKLEYLEDQESIWKKLDSTREIRAIEREEKIYSLERSLLDAEGQIELFKQREARLEIPPVLRWRGFFPGVSAEYRFENEVITQQTVIAGLRYDLTGAFKLEMVGRIDLTGVIVIPLRSEKFGLKVWAEYRLF